LPPPPPTTHIRPAPPPAGTPPDRLRARAPLLAGSALAAAGFTLLGLTVTATGGYLTIAGPLLLAGVGVGLAVPTTVSASLRAVSPQQAGLASGIGSTLQNIGGVFGVATVTAVFAGAGSYLSPAGFIHGLRPALLALAILAALGALPRHPHRPPARGTGAPSPPAARAESRAARRCR